MDLDSERLTTSTLPQLLAERANGSMKGFRFLKKSVDDSHYISFSQLFTGAQRVAAHVQRHGNTGERVAIMLPAGETFVFGFYGCLLSGCIAVPMYVPRRKAQETAKAICANSSPVVILTTEKLKNQLEEFATTLSLPPVVLTIESCLQSEFSYQSVSSEAQDIAFLQYTSGSTASPKGVRISHHNIIHNVKAIEAVTGFESGDSMGCWLPPYHDMGLVGGILFPVVSDAEMTLVSPQIFVQRPEIWMNLMSRYRCTISAGPNFAYELCSTTSAEKDVSDLDLSHIKTLVCGAEPVRFETLQRFHSRYASAGLMWNALSPCYGLAESTLISAGVRYRHAPETLFVDPDSFDKNLAISQSKNPNSIPLTACGTAVPGVTLQVVNRSTHVACDDNVMGEIWVAGTSVSKGYWGQADTAKHLNSQHDPTYFATGDRGFFSNGQLYLCGRYKELVIVRGKNFDPTDLERCLYNNALPPGSTAAIFSSDTDNNELIVACELPRALSRSLSKDLLKAGIVRALSKHFQITPSQIVFCLEYGLPRTSSGKIQRLTCQKLFNKNELRTLAERYFLKPDEKMLDGSGE